MDTLSVDLLRLIYPISDPHEIIFLSTSDTFHGLELLDLNYPPYKKYVKLNRDIIKYMNNFNNGDDDDELECTPDDPCSICYRLYYGKYLFPIIYFAEYNILKYFISTWQGQPPEIKDVFLRECLEMAICLENINMMLFISHYRNESTNNDRTGSELCYYDVETLIDKYNEEKVNNGTKWKHARAKKSKSVKIIKSLKVKPVLSAVKFNLRIYQQMFKYRKSQQLNNLINKIKISKTINRIRNILAQ